MTQEILDRVPGGRLIACSDEGFAPATNLLTAHPPEFQFGIFLDGKGQKFDSWETRRHNPNPPDWAILELGSFGPISTVDLDTHWHDGNHAEQGALFALEGTPGENPSQDDPRWVELLPRRPLDGHAHNVFRTPAGQQKNWTHVKLENFPDGGISRLRCYPEKAPTDVDPGEQESRRIRHEAILKRGDDAVYSAPSPAVLQARWSTIVEGTTIDLACGALGGLVLESNSNRYGHSQQLLAEASPTSMGDGWETSRSRGADHFDYVIVALARPGTLEQIVVDFTYFPLNNPVSLRLLGANIPAGKAPTSNDWVELIGRTPVKALAGSKLILNADKLNACGPFSHIRMETFPDGGANRLHIFGKPSS